MRVHLPQPPLTWGGFPFIVRDELLTGPLCARIKEDIGPKCSPKTFRYKQQIDFPIISGGNLHEPLHGSKPSHVFEDTKSQPDRHSATRHHEAPGSLRSKRTQNKQNNKAKG